MATINIDKEKVNRMVTACLMHFHDSGAHPAEVIIAIGEALGRVLGATKDMGLSDIAQRELFDLAIKQTANAVLAARGEKPNDPPLVLS